MRRWSQISVMGGKRGGGALIVDFPGTVYNLLDEKEGVTKREGESQAATQSERMKTTARRSSKSTSKKEGSLVTRQRFKIVTECRSIDQRHLRGDMPTRRSIAVKGRERVRKEKKTTFHKKKTLESQNTGGSRVLRRERKEIGGQGD